MALLGTPRIRLHKVHEHKSEGGAQQKRQYPDFYGISESVFDSQHVGTKRQLATRYQCSLPQRFGALVQIFDL